MRHPTEGVLRRLLDEPAGVAVPDRQHVVDCPQCLQDLADARDDAALVDTALGVDDRDLDTAAAWSRLSTAVAASGPSAPVRTVSGSRTPASRTPASRTPGSRGLVRQPAAAVLAVALVVGGASAAAAGGWLQVLRTEQVAAVSITTADLLALPDLSSYGELSLTGDPDVHEVADAAAAAAESGLDVPSVADLPRGVTGEPVVQVGGQATATFTFSAARAAQAAAEQGESLPAVPPGLDGSSVRLVAGPGVAQVWSSSAGAPALVVGRAVAPTAFSTGVPFEVVRDYLLSLPGLPAEVAAQLRTFTADGSTLPLPVPADQVTTRTDEVGGVPATVLATRDRSFAGVVWVEDGVVTVVAGSLDDDEVLTVARGLS